MGYYRGDYYRGDYYRGDPGIFSSIGKFVKKAAGVALSLTPAGSIVKSLIPTFSRPPAPMLPPPGMFPAFPGFGPDVMPPPVMDGRISQFVGPQVACQLKGTRPNKSTYTVRGGGTSRWSPVPLPAPMLIAKGTTCVKIRRMNVANPRALRRAVRRAMGFKKLAFRVLRLVAPGTKRKFGGFKKRRAA